MINPQTGLIYIAASRPEVAERQSERDGFEKTHNARRRFPRAHIAASLASSQASYYWLFGVTGIKVPTCGRIFVVSLLFICVFVCVYFIVCLFVFDYICSIYFNRLFAFFCLHSFVCILVFTFFCLHSFVCILLFAFFYLFVCLFVCLFAFCLFTFCLFEFICLNLFEFICVCTCVVCLHSQTNLICNKYKQNK